MIILVAFVGMSVLTFGTQRACVAQRTIIVPINYPTISEALTFATNGDTIYVLNGTYKEDVQVDKSVRLLGESRFSTTIEGSVSLVSNDTELRHFNITRVFPPGSGGYAVLTGSSNVIIEDNIISCNSGGGIYFSNDPGHQNITVLGNDVLWHNVSWSAMSYGIYLGALVNNDYSRTNRDLNLIDNRIEGWPDWAVAGFVSGRNEFVNNTIVNNRFGMGFGFDGGGNVFRGNTIEQSIKSFDIWSPSLGGFLQDVDTTNLIDGKPLCYLSNQSNIIIDHETYPSIGFLGVINSHNVTTQSLNMSAGILFAYVTDSTIRNIEFSSKDFQIEECSSSTILDCTFNGSEHSGYIYISNSQDILAEKNRINNYSISLWNCNESRFEDNEIRNGYGFEGSRSSAIAVLRNYIVNNTVGIGFSDSTNLTISNNLLEGNQEGMRLSSSNGNHIYLNNFVKNSQQLEIYDSSINSFDNGYEGNYWSDYNGTDPNHDGIGDTNIPHAKVDWLPLLGEVRFLSLTYDHNFWEICATSNATSISCVVDENSKILDFATTGKYNTAGFCRIRFPQGLGSQLLSNNYTIVVNGNEAAYCRNWTSEEWTYIYFEYENSKDTDPPTTVDNYDGKWQTTDFRIVLESSDNESGVLEICYRINNNQIQKVSTDGQPLITVEGANNTLEYWGVDNAGNEEQHYLMTNIELDKTAPATIDDYNGLWHASDLTIPLVASDILSGLDQTYYKVNGGSMKTIFVDGQPVITAEGMNNTLEYWSTDIAGNGEEHHFLANIALDKTPSVIMTPLRDPSGDVQSNQPVRISVNVTDSLSGVDSVRLVYFTNRSSIGLEFPMMLNQTSGLYERAILVQEASTLVKYQITVYDRAGNNVTNDNAGEYYVYTVIPEFPSFLIISLFMIATLLAVIIYRRKHAKKE